MSKKEFEAGNGNVFKGLSLPNAGEHLVKAQLLLKNAVNQSRRK